MSNQFFDQPILNSPYERPARHWELDEAGQPTQIIATSRRPADFITPIPKPRKRAADQAAMVFGTGQGLSTEKQQYDHTAVINALRQEVDKWRVLSPTQWRVTPQTARLLQHWRSHTFCGIRPFFCQVEAVETAIWLTEVAPQLGNNGKRFLEHLERANNEANPELSRLALKLATGAGKTTVMAMLIAWQTINAVRRPGSKRFTRGFLIVAPGLTIKDRLRVLLPNDTESYYANRELVPSDMLPDIAHARIVITNYHAFRLRERVAISKGGRRLLQGRGGEEVQTLETEGQMLQRVLPELMGLKNILAINDEAHHCYREKPAGDDDYVDDQGNPLRGADLKAAKELAKHENAAARLWISGLEAVNRKLGLARVFDLSATPFFLAGSGYVEGTLFPWTMSDFSLMDAIECGIVKLPRVPVTDNFIQKDEYPVFRKLWEHIRKDMPKQGRGKASRLDPLSLPLKLQTALDALYGHYVQVFEHWQKAGIKVPPCFIVVCNNTSTSKLVYDFISGFQQENEDGSSDLVEGRLPLFRNHDEHGNPLSRPRTLLVDSQQLESGEALSDEFRSAASDEIERFRREIIERSGDAHAADRLTDAELLREAMNTVGKEGRLGESVRCVVSVAMLTEGWDANTVTHVLGVRAFGTQLLCEQVVGRALRRQSYELNTNGLFNIEYADVLGIPFNFTAQPVVVPPTPPAEVIRVRAIPEREHLEIRFPRVVGYHLELPPDRLQAAFNEDSVLVLTPEMVGPTRSVQAGILGETVVLSPQQLSNERLSAVMMHLTRDLLMNKWRDANGVPQLHLFGQLKRIVRQWLDSCLVCKGGTGPGHLRYAELSEKVCERISAAITRVELQQGRPVKAVFDPYNPQGSTRHVAFNTSRRDRYETLGPPPKNHVNWVLLDSDWEAEFCRVAEAHPKVLAYTKNHNLGLEVPYRCGSETRKYIPDFIVNVDDGHGADDPLHLIVEVKGYRREDAVVKKMTMDTYWVPGVNHAGKYGRWAFVEFSDVYEMEEGFAAKVEAAFGKMLEMAGKG